MAPKAKNSDQTLIGLFLDMLSAERGGAKNTLAAYAHDLAEFSSELGTRRRTIAQAATEDLRAHLGSLSRRGFAPASVARRLSAIRQLYRFLYAEGHRTDDPSAVIEGPKRGRTLPKVLSIAEVDRLLTQARAEMDRAQQPAPGRLRAARLACLIEVLYATGLRVSELVALPASAAERNARMLIVRGKGNKERLVPLNEAAKRAMDEYRALLRNAMVSEGFLVNPSEWWQAWGASLMSAISGKGSLRCASGATPGPRPMPMRGSSGESGPYWILILRHPRGGSPGRELCRVARPG
jgi:integrase/recombinase XerD